MVVVAAEIMQIRVVLAEGRVPIPMDKERQARDLTEHPAEIVTILEEAAALVAQD